MGPEPNGKNGLLCSCVGLALLAGATLAAGQPPGPEEPTALPEVDALPEVRELPDMFVRPDGSRIRLPETWLLERRGHLQQLLQHYVYGVVPAGEAAWEKVSEKTVEDTGGTTVRHFDILIRGRKPRQRRKGKTPRTPEPVLEFHLYLTLPREGRTRIPVILVLTEAPKGERARPGRGGRLDAAALRQLLLRGYGLAELNVNDIAPNSPVHGEGLHRLYREHTFGVLAAWAWGCSRGMDCLLNLERANVRPRPGDIRFGVDYNRITVAGCARLGKAALLAAALDDRFALAVPVGSGRHGAASMRVKLDVKAPPAEIPEDRAHGHLLAPRYRTFHGRQTRLPVDQHMVLALLAPRPLLVIADSEDQTHALGYQQAFLAAREVHAFMGIRERIGLRRLPGADRAMTPRGWGALMDFADWHLRHRPKPDGQDFEDLPLPKAPRNFS